MSASSDLFDAVSQARRRLLQSAGAVATLAVVPIPLVRAAEEGVRDLIAPVLGKSRADTLIARVNQLEKVDNVRQLAALLHA